MGPGCFFGTVRATHCVTRGACAQRVVCVAAGGTTPHPSSIRVHCQNVAPAEEGGRPVRGRAQRHMVFSLFNCISLRCRLLEGFG